MNKEEMLALEPVSGPEHVFALAEKELEVFKTIRFAIMQRASSLFMDGKDEHAVAVRDLLKEMDADVQSRSDELNRLAALLAEVREGAELRGLWVETKP